MIKYLLLAVLCSDAAESTSPSKVDTPAWSNDDESTWPGFCKVGGKKQSPIDIKVNTVIKDFERQFIKYGPLKFIGYDNVLVSGKNNGYTVQFSTEGERNMLPSVTGGPLKYGYILEQLHFHWLSEHSIDGVKYPMEIHFVHVRADLPVSEALNKKDGFAIIAVFCNVMAATNEINEEAEELMEYLLQLMQTEEQVSGLVLNLRKLLTLSSNSYFTYLGSLTSPECNEVVVWIVFERPIYISDNMYRKFTEVSQIRHNFRKLQSINRHVVFQPPDPFISTPVAIQMLANVVTAVTEFFRNVTRIMIKGLNLDNDS